MTSVCIYFQMHQPYRLRWFWPGSERKNGLEDYYFDTKLNEWTFHKVASKCYWPATQNILHNVDALKSGKKKFKLAYSITGVLLEQMERWDTDLLDLFKQLAGTGCVEFLAETYYHSLSSLFEYRDEFHDQVELHRQTVKDLLGYEPQVFRNTELLYHNTIAEEVEEMGFKGIFMEGTERVLEGWKSPNFLYRRKDGDLKILLRNYKLSDDVGYRFSSQWWEEYPLDAEKYSNWIAASQGDTINICMDYETFGEHQWDDTGIFWFLDALPYKIVDKPNLEFNTPSEVVDKYYARGELNVPWFETVSWADIERDPSAWLGNHMQHLNFSQLKEMQDAVRKSGDPEFLRIWRMLQISDQFYYQCTKGFGDGSVHEYFSHHGTPFDAGMNYLAVLSDFKTKVITSNLQNGIQFETDDIKKEVLSETGETVRQEPETINPEPETIKQKPRRAFKPKPAWTKI